MRTKLLGPLAALPLIAAGVVAGMDGANAASIGVGDQLDFVGSAKTDATGINFLTNLSDSSALGANPGNFIITGTTGFFLDNFFQVGKIQDLALANGGTLTTTITNFLDCSTCGPNPFTFDLESGSRTDIGSTVGLRLAGTFKAIGSNTILGEGTLTTQLVNNGNPTSFSATVTAVPEPATTAGLLAAGALGAVKARRRKKKQQEKATA